MVNGYSNYRKEYEKSMLSLALKNEMPQVTANITRICRFLNIQTPNSDVCRILDKSSEAWTNCRYLESAEANSALQENMQLVQRFQLKTCTQLYVFMQACTLSE